MYFDHFNLLEKPFQNNSHPKSFWPGSQYGEALTLMRYVIVTHQDSMLITGKEGIGKTILLNAYRQSLCEDLKVAHFPTIDMSPLDFFNFLGYVLGIGKSFRGKDRFLAAMEDYLKSALNGAEKILVIIDDAHKIKPRLLEAINLLFKLEDDNHNTFQFILAGEPELNDHLKEPEYKEFLDRISLGFQLEPINSAETLDYMKHRLQIVGAKKGFFTKQAIEEIFQYSAGSPRVVNTICDLAMKRASREQLHHINTKIIHRCAQELLLQKKANVTNEYLKTRLSPKLNGNFTTISGLTKTLRVNAWRAGQTAHNLLSHLYFVGTSTISKIVSELTNRYRKIFKPVTDNHGSYLNEDKVPYFGTSVLITLVVLILFPG